ncbi:MAG: GCN5-related N-acetyltransferase [Candidatus Angelobacter sp.]|nr:GCN5-related N-acetyltransferase [Candidatus Angelobacter sp.]
MGSQFTIIQATSSLHIAQARELFQEYGASLGFDLCFQSFETELAGLPGDYAPPSGRLLLAFADAGTTNADRTTPAGVIALHAFADPLHAFTDRKLDATSERICEMKRLYVRPQFRGQHIGQQLIEAIISAAREVGYTRMRLDTIVGHMDKAIALYRSYGFHEIPSYRPNPVEGVIYMELDLTPSFWAQPLSHPERT